MRPTRRFHFHYHFLVVSISNARKGTERSAQYALESLQRAIPDQPPLRFFPFSTTGKGETFDNTSTAASLGPKYSLIPCRVTPSRTAVFVRDLWKTVAEHHAPIKATLDRHHHQPGRSLVLVILHEYAKKSYGNLSLSDWSYDAMDYAPLKALKKMHLDGTFPYPTCAKLAVGVSARGADAHQLSLGLLHNSGPSILELLGRLEKALLETSEKEEEEDDDDDSSSSPGRRRRRDGGPSWRSAVLDPRTRFFGLGNEKMLPDGRVEDMSDDELREVALDPKKRHWVRYNAVKGYHSPSYWEKRQRILVKQRPEESDSNASRWEMRQQHVYPPGKKYRKESDAEALERGMLEMRQRIQVKQRPKKSDSNASRWEMRQQNVYPPDKKYRKGSDFNASGREIREIRQQDLPNKERPKESDFEAFEREMLKMRQQDLPAKKRRRAYDLGASEWEIRPQNLADKEPPRKMLGWSSGHYKLHGSRARGRAHTHTPPDADRG